MSKNKKSVPDRILVDHKKLEKLRKSLTRTIEDFKESVLQSLELPEEDGPLKENLRGDVSAITFQSRPTSQIDDQPAPILRINPIVNGQTGVMPVSAVEQWVVEDSLMPLVKLRAPNDLVFFAGLDNFVSSTVRNFLQKIGMRSFLPSLQGQGSRSIIEHFNEYSDFQFAVVVLSADVNMFQLIQDPKDAKLASFPRTVYELGYLVGKLGRSRVAVFYEEDERFKRPTEYFDLNYIPFDTRGQWQQRLIDQMKSAGIIFKEEMAVTA